MTNESYDELSQLTLATCQGLIGQEFIRPNESGPDVVVRLVTAESTRRDPATVETSDRPFSLIFEGPTNQQLTQGMHDLVHPAHPLPGIFLVPISESKTGRRYEAIFS